MDLICGYVSIADAAIIITLTFTFILSVFVGHQLLLVKDLERQIVRLEDEKLKECKAQQGQGRGWTVDFVKRKQELIAKGYDEKIQALEHKRRFILEKLPFIKK